MRHPARIVLIGLLPCLIHTTPVIGSAAAASIRASLPDLSSSFVRWSLQINPCIPSGDHSSIQIALTGEGSVAVLCPNAVFELGETVRLTHDNQAIYTEGFPTDNSRALIKVAYENVISAIQAEDRSGLVLSHVIIDGNRPELGDGLGALIEWGAAGTGNRVEWVRAFEPRGWSVLYIGEGNDRACNGAIARYNELGPGGRAVHGLADGISLGCRNSIIEYNTIYDVTDGGIVIFQAPGSRVANNTIRADNRIMFYGISMEDYGPYDGDFSGTVVTGNTIDARGALIRRGIAMGPYVGCIPAEETVLRSRGAVVTNNTLMGDHMGYGFVVSGVEDWTLTGNVDLSTHLVPDREQDCFGELVDHPSGFQLNPETSSGTFQADFEPAVLGFTTGFWTFQTIVSIPCVVDLIGESNLEAIRRGEQGPLWWALENSPNAEHIGECKSLFRPPDISNLTGQIMVVVEPCDTYCINLTLVNISATESSDIGAAVFFLEDFQVECPGLPQLLSPGQEASCTINDFVTPGFQVLRWHGFPPDDGGWGLDFPFPPVSVEPGDKNHPDSERPLVYQNYPNPFRTSSAIEYAIPSGHAIPIQIEIFDLRGRLVEVLVDEIKLPGSYTVLWDGRNLVGTRMSSGLYFYRVTAGKYVSSRSMILLN